VKGSRHMFKDFKRLYLVFLDSSNSSKTKEQHLSLLLLHYQLPRLLCLPRH